MKQLYIYIYPLFFRFFSHVDHYRVLSRVPCATQWVLVDYLFYIQQCVYFNPKLLIYPSPQPFPLVTINLFSMSVSPSGLFKKWQELLLNRYRVSAWDDEIVLETDGSDGGTTTWIYLMPLNCTLKNGYNGKSHVIFYHNKKNGRMPNSQLSCRRCL